MKSGGDLIVSVPKNQRFKRRSRFNTSRDGQNTKCPHNSISTLGNWRNWNTCTHPQANMSIPQYISWLYDRSAQSALPQAVAHRVSDGQTPQDSWNAGQGKLCARRNHAASEPQRTDTQGHQQRRSAPRRTARGLVGDGSPSPSREATRHRVFHNKPGFWPVPKHFEQKFSQRFCRTGMNTRSIENTQSDSIGCFSARRTSCIKPKIRGKKRGQKQPKTPHGAIWGQFRGNLTAK